ncbi:MAG: thermonuclease family protein [Brevundimonas sp.]|nr:thermonuclease family protein [Brevundimonas sp.]
MVASVAVQAPEISALQGRATVIDGDTLELHGQRLRLWGIDAPESRQTCERGGETYRCGQVAANALDRHIAGRPVDCTERDRDRYGRVVVQCSVAGRDIGAWMVRRGYAIRYTAYAGMSYLPEEAAARLARRGLWSGSFDRPWEWRRQRR